jgi:HEAT repeat protein
LLRKTLFGHEKIGRALAAWALLQIDPRPEYVEIAIPLMIETLSHEDPEARLEAATTLGQFGEKSEEIEAALKNALDDEDPAVREAVQQALDGFGK